MNKLLTAINNPEDCLNIIHVAGTNGKGSVCSMINNTLIEAGYKTGMYTSPHMTQFNERIKINNENISDKDVNKLIKRIVTIEKQEGIKLTFFETITVMAFIYFKEQEVDYVVLETGLGGRLDATNTCTPIISVITRIGKDHTAILGKKIKEITMEKAGIIKEGIPVVTSNEGEALEVIRKVCKEKNCELIISEEADLDFEADYQKENAGIAIATLVILGIGEKEILTGVQEAYWPGRFEFVEKNILLDCAHNPDGMKALVKSVSKLDYDKLFVVIGLMKKADVKRISEEIKVLDAQFIVTKPPMKTALQPEKLAEQFHHPSIASSVKEAITLAKEKATKKDLILITGSIFLIGTALKTLK